MGIGGHFWDLLKPYGRREDLDFLREKKVAVDLSFWTVQHETAIRKRGFARNPHLRITFLRTINLFSKLGAYPVFVVDGVPSRLKSRARIARFLRATGIDLSGLPLAEEGASVRRNPAFTRCIQECVELLQLLGMPILTARCEAEALCAQLNREGEVDACITTDSDAFLYGAKCVIKELRPNSKEPLECYRMTDIEAGLGLKRNQLVAISLLVGNDHDLQGVPGIGVDNAVRLVRLFPDDEILNSLCGIFEESFFYDKSQTFWYGDAARHRNCTHSLEKLSSYRLHEVAKDDTLLLHGSPQAVLDCNAVALGGSAKMRSPHCSRCGHPGNKKAHMKDACDHCNVYGNEKCTEKPVGFKCECEICEKDRRSKALKKHEKWRFKICQRIAAEHNFPNDEIIEMYLSDNHRSLSEMASNPKDNLLLCDQYEFHSIQRVKVRYGHQFYLVKWKRAAPATGHAIYSVPDDKSDFLKIEPLEVEASDSVDLLDEPDVPEILVDDGCWFLLTDENMELVQAAFPKEVEMFLLEKEAKESKSKRKKYENKSESPKSNSIQLSIIDFYRTTKVLVQAKNEEEGPARSENPVVIPEKSKKNRSRSSPNLSKSVRRRLLFD
ncbi:hypothetical protein ACLOJK_006130 [Asimina triloba]